MDIILGSHTTILILSIRTILQKFQSVILIDCLLDLFSNLDVEINIIVSFLQHDPHSLTPLFSFVCKGCVGFGIPIATVLLSFGLGTSPIIRP